MSYQTRSSSRSGDSDEAKKHADALKKMEGDILNFENAAQPQVLIDAIKDFANAYYKDITSHQLRKLYDLVRKAENWKRLQYTRPKFAYAQARLSSKNGKDFIATLDYFMALIKDDQQLKNFKLFLEAIVAYHRFYESDKTNKND